MASPPTRDRIWIVLATRNGSVHLDAQVRSIQAQTVAEWRLLARDDGSTDGTARRLHEFAREDSRIEVLEDARGRLGVTRNFGRLIEEAHARGAEVVFLADQDDVWLPDKMERQLTAMERARGNGDGETPVLVYSDLVVTGEQGEVLHASFLSLRELNRRQSDPLGQLLGQNFVTGCSVVVNRPLLDRALPFAAEAVMHDWWLALCAAAWGRLVFVPGAGVLYRQHSGNVVGARTRSIGRTLRRSRQVFRASFAQAEALLARAGTQGSELAPEVHERIRTYASLPYHGRAARPRLFSRGGFSRSGRLARTLYRFWLWLEPRWDRDRPGAE